MKFICKDFWTCLFKKQIDNLRTNHQVSPTLPFKGNMIHKKIIFQNILKHSYIGHRFVVKCISDQDKRFHYEAPLIATDLYKAMILLSIPGNLRTTRQQLPITQSAVSWEAVFGTCPQGEFIQFKYQYNMLYPFKQRA